MVLGHVPGLDVVCGHAENVPFADRSIATTTGSRCHDHVARTEVELGNSSVRFISDRRIDEKDVRGPEKNILRFKQVTPPVSQIPSRSIFLEGLPHAMKLSVLLPDVPLHQRQTRNATNNLCAGGPSERNY